MHFLGYASFLIYDYRTNHAACWGIRAEEVLFCIGIQDSVSLGTHLWTWRGESRFWDKSDRVHFNWVCMRHCLGMDLFL